MSLKKKLVAVVVALAFSVAAAVPVLAYAYDSFWTDYPYLTPYNTAYNLVIGEGSSQEQPLMVQGWDGTNSNTSKSLFPTSTPAEEVTWSVMSEYPAVIVTSSGSAYIDSEGKYAAKTTATIPAIAPYGPYYIRATHPTNSDGYTGFTITINPSDPQLNMPTNVRIYNEGFTEDKLEVYATNVSVAYNNINTGINYPSAMDALAAVADANGVTHVTNNGSEMVTGVTYTPDEETTPVTWNNNTQTGKYWTYCVYDSNGNKIDLSSNVGAEVYNVSANNTVVWYYGSWTDFPDTLPYVTPES